MFLGFKEIWETFCSDFVNYFIEILKMKLFQEDFGKTSENFQWSLRDIGIFCSVLL